MAVVPMQKIRVLIHSTDVEGVLTVLQKYGALEVRETNIPDTTRVESEAPHVALLSRIQHAAGFLGEYEAKRSLLRKLREGNTQDLNETELRERATDSDVLTTIVTEIETLQQELATKTEIVNQLEEKITVLEQWRELPYRLSELKTENTYTTLVTLPTTKKITAADITQALDDSLEGAADHTFYTQIDSHHVAITAEKSIETSKISSVVEALDGVVVENLPSEGETPAVELIAAQEALAKEKSEVAVLHDQAAYLANQHLATLRVSGELYTWEKERYAALETASTTDSITVLEGWMNQNKRGPVEVELQSANLTAVIENIESIDGEVPPVEIENNRFIQPFEIVTRLYGMPGHRDLDPTVFLAGFFFLFFGLSLTDVGYGIFLMVSAAIVLLFFKVADPVRMFAKLLFFMGLAAVLVGIVFGSYFGIESQYLPEPLQRLAQFDPIGDPLPVFYMALAFGVLQVMVGMILKIVSEAKNGNLLGGALDQGPWLLMFVLLITYLGVSTGFIQFLNSAQVLNLIYVDIGLIVLASGRHGKTILEKIQKSALSLYDSIGYFSDILSYSRLLALGLATTALAFAVNLIADIVRESVPYLGVVLAVLVLIVGHMFTLAVNTLGAFIHSARLQFVEFFGKFIAESGQEFKPLKRSSQYIKVTSDGP